MGFVSSYSDNRGVIPKRLYQIHTKDNLTFFYDEGHTSLWDLHVDDITYLDQELTSLEEMKYPICKNITPIEVDTEVYQSAVFSCAHLQDCYLIPDDPWICLSRTLFHLKKLR